MPSAAPIIFRARREATRVARSCCAAVVARSGSGGATVSDPPLRCRYERRRRGRFPITTAPPRSPGSGSTIAAPPAQTSIHGPAPAIGRVEFVAEDKDLESDEALWALYERWCRAFNQERDHDEMARRFDEFKKNVLLVDETNKAGLPYRLGINEFSDGKNRGLKMPLIPMREYRKMMGYSDSVILGRSGANLFKKDLEGHQPTNPDQSA